MSNESDRRQSCSDQNRIKGSVTHAGHHVVSRTARDYKTNNRMMKIHRGISAVETRYLSFLTTKLHDYLRLLRCLIHAHICKT